jgi:hypothetical protein
VKLKLYILPFIVAFSMQVKAQQNSEKSIVGLVWTRCDSNSIGLQRFYIDSSTTAHVFYSDTTNKLIGDTLHLDNFDKNTFIFRNSCRHNVCLWLFISAKDSSILKVIFDKVPANLVIDNFKMLQSWYAVSGENIRSPSTYKNPYGNAPLYFRNIICCTNHKTRHCAGSLREMQTLSKHDGCIF